MKCVSSFIEFFRDERCRPEFCPSGFRMGMQITPEFDERQFVRVPLVFFRFVVLPAVSVGHTSFLAGEHEIV